MAYLAGALVGALIITFLLSRLVAWPLARLPDALTRIALSNFLPAAALIAYAGRGFDATGMARLLSAASLYVPAALFWFVLDMLRRKRREAKVAPPDAARGESRGG